MTRRVLSLVLLLVLFVCPLAYAKAVSKVKIDPKSITIDVGISQQLDTTFKPASASPKLLWKSSNKSVATVDSDGVVTGMGAGTATITCKTKNGKNAKCKVIVKDPSKIVAFTFDDGPCDNTLKILEVLAKHNVKATFFMLGDMVTKNPTVAAKVAQGGHEIGSHSVDHKNLQKISFEDALAQIDNSFASIESASGYVPTLVRAPYGAIDKELAAKLNHPFIQWSVDTLDWESRDANKVYKQIMKSVKPGSIVLMHDLYSSTYEAVRLVVPELINQGYTFVTISELLERRGVDKPAGTIIF